ncbi:hypothetical protein MKX03_028665 [Papaver bracteatum]|nr:hypothetical protein MKX03_028665 [Papaver bracteatum]
MLTDGASVSSGPVCVTGAGGFIASWMVKILLEKDDPKNSHLRDLEGAKDRLLMLCKADLLDYGSLLDAINGCQGVFHTASPVIDDPVTNGTTNVIKAAAESSVRRVVFTSSIGAVYMDPNRSPDVVVDEKCWSDLDFCTNTMAEQAAWEVSRDKGGPLLQPTVNASIVHIMKYLTGSAETYANSVQAYVHVKDVALAHILAYETPSAEGRYLCAERVLHRGDIVEILSKFFPEYPIPNKVQPYKFSNNKLKDLGLEFTLVKQCLYDTVKSLQDKGYLPVPAQTAEDTLQIHSSL